MKFFTCCPPFPGKHHLALMVSLVPCFGIQPQPSPPPSPSCLTDLCHLGRSLLTGNSQRSHLYQKVVTPNLFQIVAPYHCHLKFNLYWPAVFHPTIYHIQKIQLYADDILLHKPIGRDYTSDVSNLQRDIDAVTTWVKLSGLRLNTPKAKFLLISRLRHPPPIELSVDGAIISRVPSVTHLGVSISSDLSLAAHIDIVCCKAKRQIGQALSCWKSILQSSTLQSH